ncbi:haloacid dehalogenase [Pseudoalteromonas phenolica]|uniref:Haloacid dehalogenase n=1 Tax=Pseudoalteromonas phenolica TaxID=161398 RepID=A0A5S3YP86_9GAMM|nr:haloacid dehalogenase [Pseudoalteromonas phenolica]
MCSLIFQPRILSLNIHTQQEIKQLVVFDLDRTLLNKHSQLSPFTLKTLREMDKRGIHYTIATGRSFLSAEDIIKGHTFSLPQVYTNGVVTWCPTQQRFSFDNCLGLDETLAATEIMASNSAHPFVNALNDQGERIVFHCEYKNQFEKALLEQFRLSAKTRMLPLTKLNHEFQITNISMIGPRDEVISAHNTIEALNHLIAYSGQAIEHEAYRWIDVHHAKATKGTAIAKLKELLNIESIICFGDGDNDLSMFEIADECYAPENANIENKQAATAVIGHHNEDGVAKFLTERFSL